VIRFAFVWRNPGMRPYWVFDRGECLCFGAGPLRVSVHFAKDWHQ